MNKYTPGPWTIRGNIIEGNRVSIALIKKSYSDRAQDEQRANTHLIACAPELLEALQDIQEVTRSFHDDVYIPVKLKDVMQNTISIIAKAKGENSQ